MTALDGSEPQGAWSKEMRTSIRPVERNQRIRLDDAILVAGFPGPGLVGSMSASYIIEQQKMHQIAYVESDFIMPGVMYIGGRLRHPFRIYSNDKGNACVVVCDAPIVLAGIRQLLNTVVKWAQEHSVREIMVLEGVAATEIPEGDRKPIIMSSDGKSDDHGFLSRIRNNQSSQARSARSTIVIAGYLLIVAIAISILAQNPTVTVVIGTVTGIVLGVSMQSLIGNAVAGLVLSLTRPFRIGDRITVFGNEGEIYDIGLLYTTLVTDDGDTILAPNSALLTTPITRVRRHSRPASGRARGSSAV